MQHYLSVIDAGVLDLENPTLLGFFFFLNLVGSRYLSILVIIANIEISSEVKLNISNFKACLLAFFHLQHV